MLRSLGNAISFLVSATSMYPAIFVKICGNWVMSSSLARSGGIIRVNVGILVATFPTVTIKKSHQLLVLSKKSLQIF